MIPHLILDILLVHLTSKISITGCGIILQPSFGGNSHYSHTVRDIPDHHGTCPHNGLPADGDMIQDGTAYADKGSPAYFRVAAHRNLRTDIHIILSQAVVFHHGIGVYNASDPHISIAVYNGIGKDRASL